MSDDLSKKTKLIQDYMDDWWKRLGAGAPPDPAAIPEGYSPLERTPLRDSFDENGSIIVVPLPAVAVVYEGDLNSTIPDLEQAYYEGLARSRLRGKEYVDFDDDDIDIFVKDDYGEYYEDDVTPSSTSSPDTTPATPPPNESGGTNEDTKE